MRWNAWKRRWRRSEPKRARCSTSVVRVAVALAMLAWAGLAWAQPCGGVGQPLCPPAAPSDPVPPTPPSAPPAPVPLVTPLVIEIGVPKCALETPPCFTVDVKLVPIAP